MPDSAARGVSSLPPLPDSPSLYQRLARYGTMYDFERNGAAGWNVLGVPTTMDFGKTNPNGLYLAHSGGGVEWSGIYKSGLKFPVTLTMYVSEVTYSANYNAPVGLLLLTGTPAQPMTALMNLWGTTRPFYVGVYNSYAAWNSWAASASYKAPFTAAPYYLRAMFSSATSGRYLVSKDGELWLSLYASAALSAVTGFGIANYSFGPAVSCKVDWLHVANKEMGAYV